MCIEISNLLAELRVHITKRLMLQKIMQKDIIQHQKRKEYPGPGIELDLRLGVATVFFELNPDIFQQTYFTSVLLASVG